MHFEGFDGALCCVAVMEVGRDNFAFIVPFLNDHASIIGTGLVVSDLDLVVGFDVVLFLT